MRVDWEASAADILLVAGRVDYNGVLWGTCSPSASRSIPPSFECLSKDDLPRRLASNGLMSKISIPCIFPRISRRSRPVACSISVGTVPGCAPGGRRSASVLISAYDAISELVLLRSS